MIIKVALHKVRLNQGGYTDKGRYFGIGQPLFHYSYYLDEYEHENDIRANNREHARTILELQIKNKGHKASFYR